MATEVHLAPVERCRVRRGCDLVWSVATIVAVFFVAVILRGVNLERSHMATAVDLAPLGKERGRRRHHRAWSALAIVTIFAVAVILRWVNLDRSWDINVDEITYLRLSQSVAESMQVKLYGEPFYIHPPAYFFLQAAYLKLVRPSGYIIEQIYSVRHLNVALAGLSAMALFVLGRSLGGWAAGIAAALIFAVDPFSIRMNSRAMLDTAAMWWVLLGYSVLVPSLVNARVMPPMRRLVGSGLAFGMALLTKDMMVFSTIVPLGFAFLFNWSLPRRGAFFVCFVALLTYIPYPFIVALSGDWTRFELSKLEGMGRLAGLTKIWHQPTLGLGPGSLSFFKALAENVGWYGTTYVTSILGAAAVVLLFVRGEPSHRLLAAWAASGYALLAFGIAVGAVEEQFFYYLAIPALLSAAVAWAHLARAKELISRRYKAVLMTATMIGVGLIVLSAFMWTQTHFVPDNGFEELRAFMERSVPIGSRVAVSTDTAEFLMDGYDSGLWGTSVAQLRAHRAQYVQISTKQVEGGYGVARPPFYAWLVRHAEPVFAFDGRTYGTLALYRLPPVY